jgi:outer membrane protein OmpA-like peptidoglycan-associated protein
VPQILYADSPPLLHITPDTAAATTRHSPVFDWVDPYIYKGELPLSSQQLRTGMPDSTQTSVHPDSSTIRDEDVTAIPGSDDFPEIYLRMGARAIGSVEMSAYKRFNTVYLPLASVFNFVSINVTINTERDAASGFFMSPEYEYNCDFIKGIITLNGEKYHLSASDFILGENDIFLADRVFFEVFGISFKFDEMNMFISLHSDRKLPAIRAREREIARKYLDSYTGIVTGVDKYLPRMRHVLSGAMVDWSLNYNQSTPNKGIYSYNFGLGGELAGGDFSARLYGSSNSEIDWNRMPWHWRYVNDDWSVLRQITVGDVSTSTPGMYNSVRGAKISNVPYVERRGFAKHVIKDAIEPGWEVELYLNDKLIDYILTDSTGEFTFEIPISYGTTNVTLKYYGPHGEERSDRRRLDIPFFLLPSGEFEYSLTAGELNSFKREPFAQISNRYGISSFVTAGAGLQYSEKQFTPTYLPFAFATVRLHNNMLFNAEYLHQQRARGIMRFVSYEMPDVQFAYTIYNQNTLYNPMQAKHETRLTTLITTPRTWLLNGISVGIQEQAFQNQSLVYGNMGLSFYIGRIFATLDTRAGWRGKETLSEQMYLESSITAHTSLPWGVFFSSSLNYDYAEGRVESFRTSISKRLFAKTRLGILFNHVFRSNISLAQITLSMDLPFTRVHSHATSIADKQNYQTGFSGSMGFDAETSSIIPGNRSWTDKSGISVVPFYDKNNNDAFDEDEVILEEHTNARLSGTGKRRYNKNSFTRFYELLPYHTYKLNIDQYGFSDPLYNTQLKTFAITADPNQFKTVYLPVFVSGSVEGSVGRESGTSVTPQSSVKIYFEHVSTGHMYETVSFSDGSFFLFGLRPGDYKATLDTVQLNSLSLRYAPHIIEFELKPLPEGDAKTGLRFILKAPLKIADLKPKPAEKPKKNGHVSLASSKDMTAVKHVASNAAQKTQSLRSLPKNKMFTVQVDLNRKKNDKSTTSLLDRLVHTLKQNPKLIVTLHGHSDNFATFVESQKRSEQRAKRIQDYLLKNGVSAKVIYVRGFGSRRPIVKNSNAVNRRNNNRVEIQIISTDDLKERGKLISISGMRH